MMVNIGTKVATVNIVFSTSRNATLIEQEALHYTILSTKLQQCTLSELKIPAFTISNVLACLSEPCADREQHQKSDFSKQSANIKLQKCINIAIEYLQA